MSSGIGTIVGGGIRLRVLLGVMAGCCAVGPGGGTAIAHGLALQSVAHSVAHSGPGPAVPANVLMIILDDVGVEKIGAYKMHEAAGPTPTIDSLCDSGVRFETAWATPYCSPTRAAILTGRLPSRTGVGSVVMSDSPSPGLSLDETILPEALVLGSPDGPGPKSAMIGKWHLCCLTDDIGHPLRSGFDVFSGTRSNLRPRQSPGAYYRTIRVVDGRWKRARGYMTKATTNDAVRAIKGFGDQPWFVVVSYHAAHFPLHVPPKSLHSFELSGDPRATPVAHHKAAVEAMDREIGRLLESLPESVRARTNVIVIGDNGTQRPALAGPFADRTGKGSLGEAGIRVPLVISGPAVQGAGRVHKGPVHATDLFPTVLECMGATWPKDQGAGQTKEQTVDGVSLLPILANPKSGPVRQYIYTELFRPNHVPPAERTKDSWAIRNLTHKLIVRAKGAAPELFDMVNDPTELVDLLAVESPSEEDLLVAENLLAAREKLGLR